MRARVLILGAGFGGLELATTLSEELGAEAEVTLIDKGDAFVFGYSKLDVMFGRASAEAVRLPYAEFSKPGVRLLRETILAIDPRERTVTTDAGIHEGDVLVVALGADYDLDATPASPRAATSLPWPAPNSCARCCRLHRQPGARRRLRTPPSSAAGAQRSGAPPPRPPDRGGVHDAARSPRPPPWPPCRRLPRPPRRSWRPSPSGHHASCRAGAVESSPRPRGRRLVDGAELPSTCSSACRCNARSSSRRASALSVDGYVPIDCAALSKRLPGVYAVGDVATRRRAQGRVFAGPPGRRGAMLALLPSFSSPRSTSP